MPSLHVHDWEVHQTYRSDRCQPPWIKVHRSIMRNIKWVGLEDNERGQLVSIWLLAADNNGFIPDDATLIQKLCFMSSTPDLNKFIELGFIDSDGDKMASIGCHVDAKLASTRRHDDARVTHQTRPDEKRSDEKRIKTEAGNKLPARIAHDERFKQFWEAYPRKVGKEKAKAALEKINPDDELLATIHAALAKQKKSVDWIKDNGQWIPHPATWLNGKRWEDEIVQESKKSKIPEPFLGIAGLI